MTRTVRLTTRHADAPRWRDAMLNLNNARVRTSGAMSAHATRDGRDVPEGRLRGWSHVMDRAPVTGVVLSYGTPIAVEIEGRWIVIAESHSVTTSRHQGLMRRVCDDVARTPDELRQCISAARTARIARTLGMPCAEIAERLILDGTAEVDAIEMARRLI